MSKKKKKKQPQQSVIRRNLDSKASLDKAYTAIQKVLQVYGFDPDLFESFSKQQKRFVMLLAAEAPKFKAEEGYHVPRHLVNYIAESTHRFLRTTYFGDESIGLTYLDLITYGMALSAMVISINQNEAFPEEQMKIIRSLAACFRNDRMIEDLAPLVQYIHKVVVMLSKVNFRIYGFDWTITNDFKTGAIRTTVYISSEESPIIRFVHKQKERRAFCVRSGRHIKKPSRTAAIDRNLIFPKREKVSSPPVYLDIYIQSHALQRAKERMNIFSGHVRNRYIMESLINTQRLATSQLDNRMLECFTTAENERGIVKFGYFPFIIRDDKLIIMTFLPLTSPEASEGAYLQKHFGLQMEDVKFLGMDKLSFFLTVDFEQIPVLKAALIETHIWDLIQFVSEDTD
jgi:hypothetical protein